MNPTQNQLTSPAPAVDISPADILRGAARYLEIHGWAQDVYFEGPDHIVPNGASQGTGPHRDAFPRCCAAGAIGMATYGRAVALFVQPLTKDNESDRDFDRALAALVDYLDLNGETDHDDPNPYHWNDAPGRTAAQVIAALRAAADDYDWAHATEDDLETYADACAWAEDHPTREGFLAWRAAR